MKYRRLTIGEEGRSGCETIFVNRIKGVRKCGLKKRGRDMQPCTSQFGYRITPGGFKLEDVRGHFMWTALSGAKSGLDVCRLTLGLKSDAFVNEHEYFSYG